LPCGDDVELDTVLDAGHTWPGMLDYLDAGLLAEPGQSMDLPDAAGVDTALIPRRRDARARPQCLSVWAAFGPAELRTALR
jgi:hypothetical protein